MAPTTSIRGPADARRTDYWRGRRFVRNEVHPAIIDYWEKAEFPWPLIESWPGRVIGDGIVGYGCPTWIRCRPG